MVLPMLKRALGTRNLYLYDSDCRSVSSPQAEIVKRLNGICAQVLPYLSQEVLHSPLYTYFSLG